MVRFAAIAKDTSQRSRATRIARGAAIGSRYRAEPAKNRINAEMKKMRTHAVTKSGLRTHHATAKAPIANDAQNKGLGSMRAPPAAAASATGHRPRKA